MKRSDIHDVINILRSEVKQWKTPVVTVVAGESCSPFHVLISCIISLRTKDETTAAAFGRLNKRAKTPKDILRIPVEEIAQLIYPAGFYNNKAKTIHEICQDLLDRFDGDVPDTIDELLTMNYPAASGRGINLNLFFLFRPKGRGIKPKLIKRGWQENRKSGGDFRAQQTGDLCRYPCPPDTKPVGICCLFARKP